MVLPTVVPAECNVYVKPDFFKSLCTSATSFETDAVGVPNGIRQKSAIHEVGVTNSNKEISLLIADIYPVRKAEAIIPVKYLDIKIAVCRLMMREILINSSIS